MAVDLFPDPMCFVNGLLVRRTLRKGDRIWDFSSLQTQGTTLKPALCNHFIPRGCLTAFSVNPSRHYLAEGCANEGCEMIRIYDVATQTVACGYQIVEPQVMCAGPLGTLLVCDKKTKSLLQLTFWNPSRALLSRLNRYPLKRFHSNILSSGEPGEFLVHDMSYTSHCDILVMMSTVNDSNTQLKGIDLTIAQVMWLQDMNISNIPKALTSSPEGWLCVAHGNKVVILDTGDGAILETLLPDENSSSDICDVIWCQDAKDTRLVIRRREFLLADQITWYHVTRKSNAVEYTGCELRTPHSVP